MLYIKQGVDLNGLSYNIVKAIPVIQNVFKMFGYDSTITAGLDGEHMVGSKHYTGEALDWRRYHVDQSLVPTIESALKGELGHEYDVIVHRSHFHIEYDPK